jgi:hypothetical protein
LTLFFKISINNLDTFGGRGARAMKGRVEGERVKGEEKEGVEMEGGT